MHISRGLTRGLYYQTAQRERLFCISDQLSGVVSFGLAYPVAISGVSVQ